MSETRSWWTKTAVERSASKNDIRPEPVYPVWDGFSDIPPRVVALERLWHSLKVLVFGKAVADAKNSRKNIRQD
jgi:hypothetical protein